MKTLHLLPFLMAAWIMAHVPAFRFYERERRAVVKIDKRYIFNK